MRVLDQLRLAIRTGWPAREKFDEFTLRSELGASRSAVRAALQQLADEGLVKREPARGTVINGSIRLIPISEHDDPLLDTILIETIDTRVVLSTPFVREALATEDAEIACTRHLFTSPRLRGPIGVRTSFHRVDIRRPIRRREPVGSLAESFSAVFGTSLTGIETRLGAESAALEVARQLGIPAGSVVLTREQRLSGPDGRVVELSFGHFRSDRVAFTGDGSGDAAL